MKNNNKMYNYNDLLNDNQKMNDYKDSLNNNQKMNKKLKSSIIIEIVIVIFIAFTIHKIDDGCQGIACLGQGLIILFLHYILIPLLTINTIALLYKSLKEKQIRLVICICTCICVCILYSVIILISNLYNNLKPEKELFDSNEYVNIDDYYIYKNNIYTINYSDQGPGIMMPKIGVMYKNNIDLNSKNIKPVCSFVGSSFTDSSPLTNKFAHKNEVYYESSGGIKKFNIKNCKSKTIIEDNHNQYHYLLKKYNNYLIIGEKDSIDNDSYNKIHKYDINKGSIVAEKKVHINDIILSEIQIDINNLDVYEMLESSFYYNNKLLLETDNPLFLILYDDNNIHLSDENNIYIINKNTQKIIQQEKININGEIDFYGKYISFNNQVYVYNKDLMNYEPTQIKYENNNIIIIIFNIGDNIAIISEKPYGYENKRVLIIYDKYFKKKNIIKDIIKYDLEDNYIILTRKNNKIEKIEF